MRRERREELLAAAVAHALPRLHLFTNRDLANMVRRPMWHRKSRPKLLLVWAFARQRYYPLDVFQILAAEAEARQVALLASTIARSVFSRLCLHRLSVYIVHFSLRSLSNLFVSIGAACCCRISAR
eukprot:6190639-Pleurochrysis_carterae.AAC.3